VSIYLIREAEVLISDISVPVFQNNLIRISGF